MCTPPVGTVLFVGAAVGETAITRFVRSLVPLSIAMVIALIAGTNVPAISLWLPRLFGL